MWPVIDLADTKYNSESIPNDAEMFQLCSSIPTCENILIREVRDWLEMVKVDAGFEILRRQRACVKCDCCGQL